MYTGVCLDVMYVTILAIEYSTQMYQCLKLLQNCAMIIVNCAVLNVITTAFVCMYALNETF